MESLIDTVNNTLNTAVGLLWGTPLVVLLVGTGVLLTIAMGFPQIRGLRHALDVVRGKFDDPDDPGEISHFQALTTALSATVGLGNIAGVAVAISLGGPGAVFWMIMVGVLGMATKFSEVSVSLMYRHVDEKGVVHGGGMHYIERGLGKAWKPMAIFFATATMCASFGAANMFQTNQVASILSDRFDVPNLLTGIVISVMTGVVIIGGIKRIGKVTSTLVPLMGGIYIAGCIAVIAMNISEVPSLLYSIVYYAFNDLEFTTAGGAISGIAVREIITQGVRRACFSNEAGLGSSPIAHSAATTKEPVREGVVALLEPLVDTIVVCTMTALVILNSGQWVDKDLTGVDLTAAAFDHAIPGFGGIFVPVAVFLFAYSTLLSWSYYGEQAVSYLFGPKGLLPYKLVFCIAAVIGAVWSLGPIIAFSDIMLGLMVIPNLIAVLLLTPKLRKEVNGYFRRLKNGEFAEH
ncbi:MAG: sodium:alanine symporter family protein [Bdellovibrionales bacterium]|nr:sodium:alanine symporter family protein [Bdellovibrionales bacterium]